MLKSSLSGALTWMTRAGGFRYVRATISTDLDVDQMIATVAHELQHAVEVIEDESVIDEAILVALYKRIGQRSCAAGPSRLGNRRRAATRARVRRELVAVPDDRRWRARATATTVVTSEFVPVMLCPASGPSRHRPRLACPTKQHVRGLLRVRSAAVQPDA